MSLLDGAVAEEFSCKERPVTCVDGDGEQVNNTFCSNLPKPPGMLSLAV